MQTNKWKTYYSDIQT